MSLSPRPRSKRPTSAPKIGVFDSGHGGLTVLDALIARFPTQDFLYLGDHARAPYGERNAEAIYLHTKEHVAWLFDQGCQLVILACNTASAVSLRRLQQTWLPMVYPDHRILGVLVPMVEKVTGRQWHEPLGSRAETPSPLETTQTTIAIFATPQTVASDVYRREIMLRAPKAQVLQQSCPALVSALEGHRDSAEINDLVENYVGLLLEETDGVAPDSAILGCTHYQLCADHFRGALPVRTEILVQPAIVSDSLEAYVQRHPHCFSDGGVGEHHLITTGNPAFVSERASDYLGRAVRFSALASSVPPPPRERTVLASAFR